MHGLEGASEAGTGRANNVHIRSGTGGGRLRGLLLLWVGKGKRWLLVSKGANNKRRAIGRIIGVGELVGGHGTLA